MIPISRAVLFSILRSQWSCSGTTSRWLTILRQVSQPTDSLLIVIDRQSNQQSVKIHTSLNLLATFLLELCFLHVQYSVAVRWAILHLGTALMRKGSEKCQHLTWTMSALDHCSLTPSSALKMRIRSSPQAEAKKSCCDQSVLYTCKPKELLMISTMLMNLVWARYGAWMVVSDDADLRVEQFW